MSHSNITDNRDLLGSLLWGDGRHLAFVRTADRSKFNCSCAVPRSVRGCWMVTTWETQRDQLWSVAHSRCFSIGIEYLVRVLWLRAQFETLLSPPKLCSNSAQNIHTEQRQLHKTEWCALFSHFLSQEQEGEIKSSATAPFLLTLSGTPCPSISDNSWGCSIVVMQDLAPYPSQASSWDTPKTPALIIGSWAVSSPRPYQKNCLLPGTPVA